MLIIPLTEPIEISLLFIIALIAVFNEIWLIVDSVHSESTTLTLIPKLMLSGKPRDLRSVVVFCDQSSSR